MRVKPVMTAMISIPMLALGPASRRVAAMAFAISPKRVAMTATLNPATVVTLNAALKAVATVDSMATTFLDGGTLQRLGLKALLQSARRQGGRKGRR